MRRRAFLSLVVALCAAFASPVWAQGRYGGEPGVQPLDRILPMVRNGRPGRFYDAEGPFPDAEGGYHYRIKWLTPDGRVVWLDTDARTGRVFGTARGDWREQGPPPVAPYFRGPTAPYGPAVGYPPGGNRFGGPPGAPYGGAPRGGWRGPHGGERGPGPGHRR
jgi:hypothetical protein